MELTREDLRELRDDFREGVESVREEIRGLGEKLTKHAEEDASRETKTAVELSAVRTKLDSLAGDVVDRNRFVRGWIAGLLALAVAAAVGFLVRSAIQTQVEVARPVQLPQRAAP